MKKRSILVVLAAALTFGNVVPVAAAPFGSGRNGRCGQNYVDADGDGVCDNFVDEDGDGVNDNCPGLGNGQGRRNGQGQVQPKAPAASTAKKSTIKKVQRRLNNIGYNCGKVNGVMNAKTKKSLIKFKKTKGLKPNSVIDKPTLKALRISK